MRSLGERVRALRRSLLHRASTITPGSSDREVTHVYAAYFYLKRVVVREASEPGEARELLRGLFAEPEFATFWKIRCARYRQTPEYRERRRAYDRKRYEARLKEQRSDPEARAVLARRRREQRAAKRETGGGQ